MNDEPQPWTAGPKAWWIVVEYDRFEDASLICRRCSAVERLVLPVTLEGFTRAGQAFVDAHKSCMAPAEAEQGVLA